MIWESFDDIPYPHEMLFGVQASMQYTSQPENNVDSSCLLRISQIGCHNAI